MWSQHGIRSSLSTSVLSQRRNMHPRPCLSVLLVNVLFVTTAMLHEEWPNVLWEAYVVLFIYAHASTAAC